MECRISRSERKAGADNGDRGQRGKGNQPQRVLLPELSLVKSSPFACPMSLTCLSLAHFTDKDVEAQMVCYLPKATQQSWNQKPQRSGFPGAPWGAWTVLMSQTGSESRGLKLVKIQLVGGELAAVKWKKEMAGPRDPMPKVSRLEHQVGEGQR